jgi:hypothetical protein
MTCICSRAARGFAFTRVDIPAFDRPPTQHACSMTCLNIIAARQGVAPMPAELNRIENEAVIAASPAAGEYLEAIGETDLSRLTPEQWTGFIGHVFKTVAGEVQRLFDEGEVPF